ncbi:hypothetical protein EZ456_07405 [Pedobacter psychrodurus]|uniref:Uncharacterized protein n=1 Tax=Pedobacter psychrodurus TaxID=2530456 RepID=A0A4R0Q533_9SPHI|nr:hypothetical protein [Pedobacter psychrodurus]TCD27767.1 hypothetical protein EZ456_07405 [Pedobacter psychrodurus]
MLSQQNKTKIFSPKYIYSSLLILILGKFLSNIIINLNQNSPENYKDLLILLTVILWVFLPVYILYKGVNRLYDFKAINRLLPYVVAAFFISFIPEIFLSKTRMFDNYIGTQIVYGCNSGDGDIQYVGHSGIAYKLVEIDQVKREILVDGHCLKEDEGFMFWQTALAEGYLPNTNVPLSKFYSFTTFIEIAFTVGPIYVIENLMKMLVFNLPIFLLLLLLRLVSNKKIML